MEVSLGMKENKTQKDFFTFDEENVEKVSKKKKNEPSDILGKTITAESANKKHKICYITEEQLNFLIGTKK